MQYNRSPIDSIKSFFRSRSALSNLIIINIALFIIINVVNLFLYFFNIETKIDPLSEISKIAYWLAVPADIGSLIRKPWTLFTYMFLQEDFMHLLFNMIVLYFGGKIFTDYLSNKKLVNTYVWGGIIGALFFIITFNIFPVFNGNVSRSVALGSSASVLAILIAAATYVPNYTVQLIFIGRVKLKYIAIVFVVLDILSIERGNPGGHIAHIGGAAWGYLSIILMKKGYTNPLGINWYGFSKILDWFKQKPKSSFKDVHYNKRPVSDEDYNKKRANRQKNIDEILEKISRSGYESLSKEEKELLFKASNKN